MPLSPFSETIKIFFSFAPAPEDERLFEKLRKHLSALKRQGLIDMWYDSAISARSNVKHIIESYMSTADIIVLLISADFFDSEQCAEVEMHYALQQHALRAAPVIPVLLRPTEWQGTPLDQYHPLPSDGKAVSIWDNLDTALAEVARGIRRVVEELASRLTSIPSPPKRSALPLYLLPDRRNPFFTDRDELFSSLHHYFTTGQTLQTRTQALYGLGGIGKTLLALEYAYRYQEEYQAVFWLNATPRELLNADLLSLAEQLGVPVSDQDQEHQRITLIKRWLQQHKHWFLILDNLEDFEILNQLVPSQSSGHVLFVTHSQATGPYAHAVSVAPMTTEEGALLLLRRAKIISEQALRETAFETDLLQARAIVQEVEGYPLALDQAGAYIEETQRSLASYLALYRKRQTILLGMRGRLANDHPNPVTTTLSLTFEKIAQIDPNALELLHFFAFLHPDALPDEMLTYDASALNAPLQTLLADPILLDRAIATLQRFSLVQRQADTTTLKMHRVVQAVLLEGLTKEQQAELAKQAVRLLNATFPAVLFPNWTTCQRYLPHAQRCAELIHDFQLTLNEAGELLQRLGSYCYKRALYTQAEAYLVHALHLREQQLPPEHPDIAETLNALALLYNQLGNYYQAEPLYIRALALREQAFGSDHDQTAQSLNNLGCLYLVLKEYPRAEGFLQRALSIYEQTLGPEEGPTLSTLNNLAIVYQNQGNYPLAGSLLQRALALRERTLDPLHPDIAQNLNTLGIWYQEQGQLPQAESLFQRALSIYEQTVGPTHPDITRSLNTLATLYDKLENYAQAEAFYQRALTILEQSLGKEHPDTARILNNMAFLFQRQGQYQRAESLYQQAFGIYEQVWGPEHVRTAIVLDNLGRLSRLQGKYEAAEPLLRRALAIREKTLGSDHLDTARSLNGLAQLLTDQGQYEQAEAFFLRAIAIRQRVLGLTHPDLIPVLENYALLLERTNRTEEASTFRQTARTLREQGTQNKG